MVYTLFVVVLIGVLFGVLGNEMSSIQFTPSGRLPQIEFARTSVSKGSPTIGVRCTDGLVMVSMRPKPSALSLETVGPQKVFRVDNHVMIAASGLLSDAGFAVNVAKSRSLQHRNIFSEPIPVASLVDDLAELFHAQTIDARTRPLGVGLLIGGYDPNSGYQLFTTDPDGSYLSWSAACIGSAKSDEVMQLLDQCLGNGRPVTVSEALSLLQTKVFSSEVRSGEDASASVDSASKWWSPWIPEVVVGQRRLMGGRWQMVWSKLDGWKMPTL